jgi:hypothetical protein
MGRIAAAAGRKENQCEQDASQKRCAGVEPAHESFHCKVRRAVWKTLSVEAGLFFGNLCGKSQTSIAA